MFCAVSFAICFLGFLGVSGYALATGNPENMFSGVDGNGRVCGQPGATSKFPYLLVVPYTIEE